MFVLQWNRGLRPASSFDDFSRGWRINASAQPGPSRPPVVTRSGAPTRAARAATSGPANGPALVPYRRWGTLVGTKTWLGAVKPKAERDHSMAGPLRVAGLTASYPRPNE